MLTQATSLLSGLSRCAGLVVTTKQDSPLKHVEFISAGPGKALVIMVSEDGQVENRVIATPSGLPPSALTEAGNYLNARLRGRTIDTARSEILTELEGEKAELDSLTAKIVAEGLATLSQPSAQASGDLEKVLIVRGTSHLLNNLEAQADIERVRTLFDDIERKADPDPAAGTGQGRRRGADFHRVREPPFQPVGVFHRRRALCQCRRQDRGGDRHPGSHKAQLWPHHPHGGPHRQGDRQIVGMSPA